MRNGEYLAITTGDVTLHGNGYVNRGRRPINVRPVITGASRNEAGQERFGARHFNTHGWFPLHNKLLNVFIVARPDGNRPGRYLTREGDSVYTHFTMDNLDSPRAGTRDFVDHQRVAATGFN